MILKCFLDYYLQHSTFSNGIFWTPKRPPIGSREEGIGITVSVLLTFYWGLQRPKKNYCNWWVIFFCFKALQNCNNWDGKIYLFNMMGFSSSSSSQVLFHHVCTFNTLWWVHLLHILMQKELLFQLFLVFCFSAMYVCRFVHWVICRYIFSE